MSRRRTSYDHRSACFAFRPPYAGYIGAKNIVLIGRKFGWLLVAALVALSATLGPGWRFQHMTAAEHLDAARSGLEGERFDEAQRHLDAAAADTPGAARLTRKLAAARQVHSAALQQEAESQLAQAAKVDAQRAGVRELEQNLRNRGFNVTVVQSIDPQLITIASPGFDDRDQRDRFLTFLRGPNSPLAAACAAGIQAVRLKGPGVFFGFSDRFSLDCYMR